MTSKAGINAKFMAMRVYIMAIVMVTKQALLACLVLINCSSTLRRLWKISRSKSSTRSNNLNSLMLILILTQATSWNKCRSVVVVLEEAVAIVAKSSMEPTQDTRVRVKIGQWVAFQRAVIMRLALMPTLKRQKWRSAQGKTIPTLMAHAMSLPLMVKSTESWRTSATA